jgi:protein-disulfide isomerase
VAKGLTTYAKPAPAPRTPTVAANPTARAEPDPAAVYGVNLDGDPFRGNANALVTIVRGGEYACPYCDRVRPTLDQLLRAYPDEVRVVYMDFVVHPDTATEPARAACAANRQGKFWVMDELIWEKAFKTRQFTAAHMEDLAREAKLDLRRYRADLASCADEVRADMEKLTRFGVRGTPAFFINGRYLAGAQPYARFEAIVEEELAKARARIAQGTSRSDYYGTWVVGAGLTSFTPLAEAPAP